MKFNITNSQSFEVLRWSRSRGSDSPVISYRAHSTEHRMNFYILYDIIFVHNKNSLLLTVIIE